MVDLLQLERIAQGTPVAVTFTDDDREYNLVGFFYGNGPKGLEMPNFRGDDDSKFPKGGFPSGYGFPSIKNDPATWVDELIQADQPIDLLDVTEGLPVILYFTEEIEGSKLQRVVTGFLGYEKRSLSNFKEQSTNQIGSTILRIPNNNQAYRLIKKK